MDIRNCRNCGNMFQYVGDKICPKCKAELETKLQEVKKFIDEHDRATVQLVADECDVTVKQIRRWIQEDRLMFAPGVDTGLVCSKCGMPVESGTMCKKCKDSLKNALKAAGAQRTPAMPQQSRGKDSSKMHLTKYQ